MPKQLNRKLKHHYAQKGTVLLFLFIFFFGLSLSATAASLNSDFKVFRGPTVTFDQPTAHFLTNEVIVKLKNDSAPFRRVKISTSSVAEIITQLRHRADVEFAEPNYIAHTFAAPNDPFFNAQWHFDNPAYGGVNAKAAWDSSQGSGVIVAVIDTGIAYENYTQSFFSRYYQAPDLASTCFVGGYDFVNNDTHPNDDNSHGTHVAGTIAQSTNNSTGVAGLAYQSCLMPIKVLASNGSGTYADIAEGIRWAADHGAQVINLSLGGASGSSYLEDALEYAYNKGVTILAATGNDGKNIVSYPAAYDNYVIAVGATRYNETRAPYSNYGASLDIVAPGGDTNVDQNNDGYPDGVLQNTFNPSTKKTSEFNYWFFQGTSMATPHVAAAAALVISNGNATSPDQVRAALQSSAKDLGSAGWDSTYGWGRVNAAAALGSGGGPIDPANNPPTANAGQDQVLTDDDANNAENVTVNASGSTDSDGSITSYQWQEGSTTILSSQSGTISLPVGSHTIVLTVTDNEGATDADTVIITVNANQAPTANAGADQSATVGNNLNFSANGSSDPDGSITSYAWNFGDGQTASGATTAHSYAATGTYTVTLTVTDNGGATDSDTATISVTNVPSQPTMRVSDISFIPTVRNFGSFGMCRVTATVSVVAANGSAVASATVSGSFSGASTGSVSGTTNGSGKISFTTGWVIGCGNFTFSVNNVVKNGWIYQPANNTETVDSIVLP